MDRKNETIKVAVTVWGNRVSPVFDSATTLLIAEISEAGIGHTYNLSFRPDMVPQLVQVFSDQGIRTIICGAISEEPAVTLKKAGIELIAFIAGNIDRVLHNYIQEQPAWSDFIMPGCQRKICCQGRIRKGHEIGAMLQPKRGSEHKGIRMHRRWDDQGKQNQAGLGKNNTGKRYTGD